MQGEKLKRNYINIIVFNLILIMIIYVGINMYKNNKRVEYKTYYNEIKKNSEMNFVTLQHVREEREEVLEKLQNGYYKNLSATQVQISLSEGDYVTEMKEYDGGIYHGITDAGEMYDEQMRVIHYFLGDDLREDYLFDANCLRDNGEDVFNLYLKNDEIVEHINNNTYDEIASFGQFPRMFYGAWSVGENIDKRYCSLNEAFIYIPVIKGKYLELADTDCEDPAAESESIATYYPNTGNLDDVYMLDNGSISIKDAIGFVEHYWADCLPYDTAEGVSKKVRQVDVYLLNNGNYCLRFAMTREFNGLLFEYEYFEGNGSAPVWWTDSGVSLMVETDDVDEMIGEGNGFKVEETGDKSFEVVSLESAISQISNKIGQNSEYDVECIEMAYRQKIVKYETDYAEFKGIPSWYIRCRNKNSGIATIFYINLMDGNISYQTDKSQFNT